MKHKFQQINEVQKSAGLFDLQSELALEMTGDRWNFV